MGEIREPVTRTNEVDDALADRGLLPPDQVRQVTALATVDPEAVRSVLPQSAVDRLGLNVNSDGWTAADIAGPVLFACHGRTTVDEAVVGGTTAVIGRTVLAKWDLVADHAAGRLVPHPARPDRPVSMVR